MKILPLLALLFALPLLAAPPTPPAAHGYALIVTNNRSLDASQPDLHYADDDGAKYAQLFSETLGRANVTLLTTFDPESERLFPEWAQAASTPSREHLISAVDALAGSLEADRNAGLESEVYFVFAGHGDVEGGQGFVELEDAKLTARDLEMLVVKKLPATHLHLILDSCNSYFMLSPRKPGGRRWELNQDEAQGLLARYPNVGALLSTSAEAVTYEWSELQSGIFSYEVRSGLRGAADADGDGNVTYAELAAFVSNANRAVANDLYRPKVFASPPAHDLSASLLRLPQDGRTLRISAAGGRRLTIRDANGVRLLDVNKEDGTSLRLLLPQASALDVQELLAAKGPGERPTVIRYSLPEQNSELDSLLPSGTPFEERGESPVFDKLFAEPFGQKIFAQSEGLWVEVTRPPTGIAARDVERLRLHLEEAGESARQKHLDKGYVYMAEGMFLLTTTAGLSVELPEFQQGDLLTAGLGAGILWVTVGIGSTFWWDRPQPEQVLLADFSAQSIGTEEQRSLLVLSYERRFRELAEREGRERRATGFGYLIGGGVQALVTALLINSKVGPPALWTPGLLYGGLFAMNGLWDVAFREDAAELAWRTYQAEPEVDNATRASPGLGKITFAPVVKPGGGGVALGANF